MQLHSKDLKQQAQELGFVLAGVTAAAMPGRLAQFQAWLDSGMAASMHYFEDRRKAYEHPEGVLDGCRSILMLGMPYASEPHPSPSEETSSTQAQAQPMGKVARYAQGNADYHDLIHRQLKKLKRWLLECVPEAKVRGVVDTAPLLEREFAELAGLGWVGKNTLLLNQKLGSYFFLAALLTDLELEVDPPQSKGYCGTCTACLDNCPTNAFPSPYVLDANRCISYLTIEHRERVDEDLSEKFEGWVFGCDICQEVCPWNRKVEEEIEPELEPQRSSLPLAEILNLDENSFREQFRKLPFWRSRRRGLIRNALLLVAHQGLLDLQPDVMGLANDPDELIAETARWTLSKWDKLHAE